MSLKTGFSKICINPPLGSPIVGYYQERLTKGIADDIFVRAVCFDDGEKKAVVLAVDVCLLNKTQCDEYRKMISDFTSIDFDKVFITCSHTHTGPLIGKDFASSLETMPAYLEYFKLCLRDAAGYAVADLAESQVYTAEGTAKNISFIRRFRMKDGSVKTNPGIGSDIDYALGEPNETVKLLKIKREGRNDLIMVNFGTHPDSVGGDLISADYPGYVCQAIEGALPDTDCMFLLAPQGDVNHINPFPTEGEAAISVIDFDSVPRSLELAKHMGRVIAGAVLSVCTIAKKIEGGKIQSASAIVTIPSNQENDRLPEARKIQELYESGRADELPYKEMELTTKVAEARRIIRLENGPQSYDFCLSAIKIGDFVFAGIPGEPFTDIANRIYENSPFDTTILCCLANGGESYFPTTKAYSEGGYEAGTSSLAPGGDDIIVNGMCELLKELN